MTEDRLIAIGKLLSRPPDGWWSRCRHRWAIDELVADDSAEAREVLCRAAGWDDHPFARATALDKGWAPGDPALRALFYLLTGQLERYEALDFDQSLLKTAWAAVPTALRRRLAERIRLAGRPEWAQALHSAHDPQRLAEMSDDEWAELGTVLREGRRWEEVFQWLFVAPFSWSARMLRVLRTSGWEPGSEDDRVALRHLLALVPDTEAAPRLLPQRRRLVRCGAVVALAPSQPWLATADSGGRVRILILPGENVLTEFPGHEKIKLLAFSPDGRWLAGAGEETVRLWLLSGTAAPTTLGEAMREVHSLTYSPDSQWLAVGSVDHTLRVYELASGQEAVAFREVDGARHGAAFAPDGTWLATSSGGGVYATIRAIPSGKKLGEVVKGKSSSLEGTLAVSPDGRWLAAIGDVPTARLWEAQRRSSGFVLVGHELSVMAFAFSPDNHWLATGGHDDTARLWDVSTRQQKAVLWGHNSDVLQVGFSPDGRWLVTAGTDAIRIWDAAALALSGGSPPDAPGPAMWGTRDDGAGEPIPEGRRAQVITARNSSFQFAAAGRWLAVIKPRFVGRDREGSTVFLWEIRSDSLPLAHWTHYDLAWATRCLAKVSDGLERRWWELLTNLLRHKFRTDVALDTADHVLDEFDVELSDLPNPP